MNYTEYNPYKEVEVNPDEHSFSDKVSAVFNQNITGAKKLQETGLGSIVDPDFNFNSDEVFNYLQSNNVSSEKWDDFSDAKSMKELQDKVSFNKSNRADADIVSSMGLAGIASSFLVGVADPVGWAFGGVAGKSAQLTSRLLQLQNKGVRISQGTAGLVAGLGSYGALEYSLDGEVSDEALAVTSILGFGIGFGTAGGMLRPSVNKAVENMTKNGVQADPKKKVDMMLGFMHSSADRLKGSDNPMSRDLGYKISRSMKDTGLQGGDTANDYLADYTQHLNRFKEDFDNFKVDYEKKNGAKFSKQDEVQFLKEAHEIDNEYNTLKNKMFEDELLEPRRKAVEELTARYNQEIESINLKYGSSKKNAQKRGAEKQVITKRYNKDVASASKWKPEGDDYIALTKRINEKASQRIDDIISSKTAKFNPILKSLQTMTKRFGDDIATHDLNGIGKTIDSSWYVPRAYNVDKIVENRDSAIEAFKQALMSNFDNIAEADIPKFQAKAKQIVDNITNVKADYDAFDADINTLREKKSWVKMTSGNLKGRKLKLDSSKLVDFMQDDIIQTMSSYSRRVGGELALKRSIGVDGVNSVDDVMNELNIHGKDRNFMYDAVDRIKGTSEIDPNANSPISKVVRGFNTLNYLNFGGWFGVNTLTDISNIVYDYGFGRTMKYIFKDINGALRQGNNRDTKKIARIIGLSSESLTNDRAILMGAESIGQGQNSIYEKSLGTLASTMSKLSGLNMTIDLMDRVVSMSSLDYILTKNANSTKFIKTMNRLGLSKDDIAKLRNSRIADIKQDGLHNVNFNNLDSELTYKIQRAMKRATRDTVLRANEIDSPAFLSEIMGSKSLAKAMFQFMRFPVTAYNKLGIKMKENWSTADAVVSTMTATAILTLVNQAKDIGKDEPRYDLGTKEGVKNNIVSVVERLPHMSIVSVPQSYVDILGRLGSSAVGEDYKGRPSVNFGITADRLSKIATAGGNLLSFKPTGNDLLTATSFAPFQNLPMLSPLNNMFRDEVRGTNDVFKRNERIEEEDIERYLSQEYKK